MGASGKISWFTERKDLPLAETTRKLLEAIGPVDGIDCSRYHNEDSSWARFMEEEEHPDRWPTTPGLEWDTHGRVSTFDEASSWPQAGKLTHITPFAYGFARKISESVRRDIPREISGDCVLATPGIWVGGFDLWDIPFDSEDDKPVYYGRSTFCVSLDGSFTPKKDWREYERLLVRIPEVRQFEREIESILGPLKRCIIWSV